MDKYNASVSNTDKDIIFTIVSDKTILDDELLTCNANTNIDVLLVDNLIKEFNILSNGLVIEYNYKLLNNQKSAEIELLFKHVFNKFGETQKYVTFLVTYDEKNKTIEAVAVEKKSGLTNIHNCQRFPFNRIHITNTMENNLNKTTIKVHSNNSISTYKNYNMILAFTKKLVYDNYKHIEKYIKICKNH